jgi:hypothetical protein
MSLKVILNIESTDMVNEVWDTLEQMVKSIAETTQCEMLMSSYDSGVMTVGTVDDEGTYTIDAVYVIPTEQVQ